MVRISDILKKKMRDSPVSREPDPPPSVEIAKAISQNKETSTEKSPEMQIAKAMKESQPKKEYSKNLYISGIQLAKDVLNSAKEAKPIDLIAIKGFVASIVDSLVLGDKELLNLFYEHHPDNYIYSHIVNVLIMSVDLGLGLGYNKSKLNELGLAAFLHDIGMIKVEEIALQPRSLSEEEYNQIKEHPLYGTEILSKIKDLSSAVIYAAKEDHERWNGEGYPLGVKDGEISEYARIIATIDVYEALTHSRTYRKKYLPHEAIKDILTTDSALFDPIILRILISRIGIYPIGSWVELNTNEIGKVITTNDEYPLKPIVNVIFDNAGNRLEQPCAVNLAKQFNFFIKRPLTDEEVLRKIKEEVRDEESR